MIYCERWISSPENGFLQSLSLDGERFFKELKSKSFPGKGVLKIIFPGSALKKSPNLGKGDLPFSGKGVLTETLALGKGSCSNSTHVCDISTMISSPKRVRGSFV